MAVSSVSPTLVSALFGSSNTSGATAIAAVSSSAKTGTMMADKAVAETTRKEIVKVIGALGELEQLVGEATTDYDADQRAQATPTTLMDRVDQAATATDRQTAVDKYNALKDKLETAIKTLPSFSNRANLADKAAINAVLTSIKSFIDAKDPAALKDASMTASTDGSTYDFSAAGNADGTDLGRSEARATLSDLAATISQGVELLRVEAQRTDMRWSAAAAGVQAAGTSVISSSDQSKLASLEKELLSLMKRASLFQRTVGDAVGDLNSDHQSIVSAESLQDFVTQSEITSNTASAASNFNTLREQMVTAIESMSTAVNTKYSGLMVDKTRVNALLEKMQQFVDSTDPEYLREAGSAAAATGADAVFNFSTAGNAAGTDLGRSEARRVLNNLGATADDLVEALGVELTSIGARRGAKVAASYAAGGAGDASSAASTSANYDNARRNLQTSLKVLDEVEALIGNKAEIIKGDAPLSAAGTTMQDLISKAADSTKRSTAVSDFNRQRDTVLKKLGSLSSVGGSVFNDSDAVQAAGDALTAFLSEGDGELRAASTSGVSSSSDDSKLWDFSEEGLATGLDSGRSAARLTLNRMLDKLQNAREIYSRELLQISIQAEAAAVGAKTSINALADSQSSTLMGLIATTTDPALTQAQTTERQAASGYTTLNSVLTQLGQSDASYTADERVASSGVTTLADFLDQTATAATRSSAIRKYNSASDTVQTTLSKLKNIAGSTTTINTSGLNATKSTLKAYFDDSSASTTLTNSLRPDRLRDLGTDSTSKTQDDASATGNAAGTDGKRSEARRVLSDLSDDAKQARDAYALEMLNQETRLIGQSAGSGAAAAKYAANLASYLASLSS